MNRSESIAALAKALVKAQGELENASKNASNPHYKSKYADLAEILNTVRPVFSKNGLSFVQCPTFLDGVASVETMLMHESGEWLSSTASAPASKQDAQGVGSAVTYLRRYSLAAVAGIAQEDDDANSAVGAKKKQDEPKTMPSNATIGDEEYSQIKDMITKTGTDEAKFCDHFKVKSLAALPLASFSMAMAMLNKKLNSAGE